VDTSNHDSEVGLPADIPPGVKLLDRDWLTAQMADGARLTLLPGQTGEFLQNGEFEAYVRRLKTEKSANEALRAIVQELQRGLGDHQEKLRVALQGFLAAQSDADDLRQRAEELHEELRSSRAQAERLEKREQDALTELRSVQAALTSSQSEVLQLQQRNEQLEEELAAVETRAAALGGQVESQESAQSDHERKLADYQSSLASAQLEVTRLRFALQEAERPAWKKLSSRR